MESLLTRLKTEEFDYSLPSDLIAYEPLEKRDASRLMVIEKNEIKHSYYNELHNHLSANARLVFNNTKVIAARLLFKNLQHANIETFLLEPENGDYASLHQKETSTWKCLIGGAKKWKNKEVLIKQINEEQLTINLSATLVEKKDEAFVVTFQWNQSLAFYEILERFGNTPLPPYIKREANINDVNRYQTVFATSEGSVAAPTAGLHFTNDLLEKLRQKNIQLSYLTLHVGAGTFKPVTTSSIAEHTMHKEFFEVTVDSIAALCDASSNIIPVGTTSLRTLESLYWIGLKLYHGITGLSALNNLEQWEHFKLMKLEQPSYITIFNHLLEVMKKNGMQTIHGHTGICITPGYNYKVAKGLITNFHQPQSTLLLIIASMLGDQWKKIYKIAIEEKYRFLSYGDGMLILM
ncbi:MAG: S-adenosylmethionine:tRNA ribosyltransferase-isomerase [Chitinophagaceae bacterium]